VRIRPRPEQLVELWNLTTMPTEDVLFWQSYVDDKIGLDGKPLCSAIVALLVDDPNVFSDMHRLPTDELWHFYLGDPIELLLLSPDVNHCDAGNPAGWSALRRTP
jgi:predicted cupin superfamily sugar epimerase